MTIGAVILVDRKGRKFLLSVGTAGVVVSLVCTGLIFKHPEELRADCRKAIQAMVSTDQTASIAFNQSLSTRLLDTVGPGWPADRRDTDLNGRKVLNIRMLKTMLPGDLNE